MMYSWIIHRSDWLQHRNVESVKAGKNGRTHRQATISMVKCGWKCDCYYEGKIHEDKSSENYTQEDMGIWNGIRSLTGDHIEISECMEFGFYGIFWFWNNQSYDTKPRFLQWPGVSHRYWSSICSLIIIYKGEVLSCTTIQHLATDEPRDNNVR